MSRGHGKVQQFVLDCLPDRRRANYNMEAIAAEMLGLIEDDDPRPPRSAIESVRRAVKSLEREGLVATTITNEGSDGMGAPELIAWRVPGGRVNT